MATDLLPAPTAATDNWDQFPVVPSAPPAAAGGENWDQFPVAAAPPAAAGGENWDQFPVAAAPAAEADGWDQFEEVPKPLASFSDLASGIADFVRGIVATTPSAILTLWLGLERPDRWTA